MCVKECPQQVHSKEMSSANYYYRMQADNSEKTIRVFIFRDYEVLARLYGLSGASGMSDKL